MGTRSMLFFAAAVSCLHVLQAENNNDESQEVLERKFLVQNEFLSAFTNLDSIENGDFFLSLEEGGFESVKHLVSYQEAKGRYIYSYIRPGSPTTSEKYTFWSQRDEGIPGALPKIKDVLEKLSASVPIQVDQNEIGDDASSIFAIIRSDGELVNWSYRSIEGFGPAHCKKIFDLLKSLELQARSF